MYDNDQIFGLFSYADVDWTTNSACFKYLNRHRFVTKISRIGSFFR